MKRENVFALLWVITLVGGLWWASENNPSLNKHKSVHCHDSVPAKEGE